MKFLKKYIIILFILISFFSFSDVLLSESMNSVKKFQEAGTLVDQKKFRRAVKIYVNIVNSSSDLDNHLKSRIYNNIGFCYHKLNEYEKALLYYKKALEIDEEYLFGLNNISALLIKLKKYNEALIFLESAFKLDENYIKLIYNLFVANTHLDNVSKAKYYLRKAFLIDSNYTTLRLKSANLSKRQISRIKQYVFNK